MSTLQKNKKLLDEVRDVMLLKSGDTIPISVFSPPFSISKTLGVRS